MMMFVGLAEPYTEKSKTFLEQLNEYITAVIIYFLMCFADTVPDIAS
jgi:hypothetical protein